MGITLITKKSLQWYTNSNSASTKKPTANYKDTNQYGQATASQKAWVISSFKVRRHTSNSEEHPVPNHPTWTSGRTRSQLMTPGNNFLIFLLKGNKMQLHGRAKWMPHISSEWEFSLQKRLHNLVSYFHDVGTGKNKSSTARWTHRKGWKRTMTNSTLTTDRWQHCPAALLQTGAGWTRQLGVTPTAPQMKSCIWERSNKLNTSVAIHISFASKKDSWNIAARSRTLLVYTAHLRETPKEL